ncbi:MAG: adenylate/guanylate cyclase domain-containing protein [Acidimicrobiales bacterium]
MPPEVRYTDSSGVRIAYQILGEGPFDIVYAPSHVTHVELVWRIRPWAEFLERLGQLGRVIVFDKRGTGMSERSVGVPDMDERMDDIRAVMDAAGSDRAALIGTSEGGTMCALFAATFPERCWALVLWGSLPRLRFARDYRGGATDEELAEVDAWLDAHPWGDPERMEGQAEWMLPDGSATDRQALVNMLLAGADDKSLRVLGEMNREMDVRAALPAISAPTLVSCWAKEPPHITYGSRAFAELIPGATFLELPGKGHLPFGADDARAFAHIEDFLRQTWEGAPAVPEFDRVLTTVVFTDVVDSTAKAAELGDRSWRELLARHHAAVRLLLSRYRGTEVDTAGDGFFARFDGPARAIRCASEITTAVLPLGIEVRAGVHTGECELLDGKVGGIAVHIGARVASHAGPGEVVVSQTVRDLIAGSGIRLEDRGATELKGVPGEWRLYRVAGVEA